MPALSERDLSTVQKFFNAMHAALALTESRRAEQPGTARGLSTPSCLINNNNNNNNKSNNNSHSISGSDISFTKNSNNYNIGVGTANFILSSGNNNSSHNNNLTTSSGISGNENNLSGDEGRVWAEAASVFWRIAGRQQTHLLAYAAADMFHVLTRLCDGLLNYIQETFTHISSTASAREILHRAVSLGVDHIFFFLNGFCALRSCICMMGGEEIRGRELHASICEIIIQQHHFHWMTRVVCAFFTHSRKVVKEHGSISASVISTIKEVLHCIQHCCEGSVKCAESLIYTEPKPLVGEMLTGMRLRLALPGLIRPIIREEISTSSNQMRSESIGGLTSAIHNVGISSNSSSGGGGGVAGERGLTGDGLPRALINNNNNNNINKTALAEYLITGRTHPYDEITREALNVAVTAVEKAEAHGSPTVITALCNIIELSSRAVIPTHEDSKSTEGNILLLTTVPLSVQIAMYENFLLAFDAICQLLRSSGDGMAPFDLALRRETILHQITGQDLSGCVHRIIYYCTSIVECESSLFRAIKDLCVPPSFTRINTSLFHHHLHHHHHLHYHHHLHHHHHHHLHHYHHHHHHHHHHHYLHYQQQQQSLLLSESPNQRITGINESFNESIMSRSGTIPSFTESININRPPPPPPPPREPTTSRGPNFAKSFWMSFWPKASRNNEVNSNKQNILSGEEPIGSHDQRLYSDPIVGHNSSLLSPLEDEDNWWYSNEEYLNIARSLTQVLNDIFMDASMSLSIRMSTCNLLAQITMRSSSAFSQLEGRLIVRSFLNMLRNQEERLQSQLQSPHSLHEEDEDTFPISNRSDLIELNISKDDSNEEEEEEEEAIYVSMAKQIISAIWRLYNVLNKPPISGEVVNLIELPLLILRWLQEIEEEFIGGEVHSTLNSLFGPIIRLWYIGLESDDDDEDNNGRSYEVLMIVLKSLLKLGTIPVSASEALDATRSISLITSTGGGVGGTLNTANTTHSDKDSSTSIDLETPQIEFGGTVKALCDIFRVLLQRNPRFLSTKMLEVLFALLWTNDTRLSKLGRKCIASSLEFSDVYSAYAEVIRGAELSLLIKLLPLFSSELSSNKKTCNERHERRVYLYQHGCVDAVITVLERVLLSPHHVDVFPRIIQQLFRFLSVFESSQGEPPQLSNTRLKQVFSERIISLEGAEFFILIAQAVLDAATAKYDGTRSYSRRVQMHGHFSLSIPNCSVEKPMFIDLLPPLLRHAHQHALELESNLLAVTHLVLKTTTRVHSDALLQWVLETKQTALLPYLELDASAVDHQLLYVGSKNELESFWAPILQEAPECSELRFNHSGGIVLTMGWWPDKGFSISTNFRFEEIYSNISLFEFINSDSATPFTTSINIVSGDSVYILREGKKIPVNENHALQDLSPRRWVHFLLVMSVAHTLSVYLNGNKIGTCTLPYFKPHSEVIIHIGFVNTPVQDALFSIGNIVVWDEELTSPQVEAYIAMTSYQPNICKILPREVPRELSESNEIVPINDRIAAFVPYEGQNALLVNILPAPPEIYPIVAKLTGNYAMPPKNWIDFRDLFLSRGGIIHLLDWIGQSTSEEELQHYTSLACDSIRCTTTGGTMDFRTYALLDFYLKNLANFITPIVCDSLLHLATAQVTVNDEQHPFIINRLVFDYIFRDMELLAMMPCNSALYLMEQIEKMFTVNSCRFARRNANYIMPFRFIDSILNGLVYSIAQLSFQIRNRVISCVKQIMIACDFEPNIVNAIASTAAILTPMEKEISSIHNTTLRVSIPKPRFSQISISLHGAYDITIMILRSFVECCTSSTFLSAFGRIVDLNWFAMCVSKFADASCVVYATELFFETLQYNSDLRNEVMQNPSAVVAALSPHSLNEELMLLLLSFTIGAAKRIDVLSSKHPLLEQLDGILNSMTPDPDLIVAPIFSKLLTLHLNSSISIPFCFKPCSISSVMQRRLHYSYRIYKYFSLVRLCSRIMLKIKIKRLLVTLNREVSVTGTANIISSSVNSINLLTKNKEEKEGEEEINNEKNKIINYWSKYHKSWSLLRVSIILWKSIQQTRYKNLLHRASNPITPPLLDVEESGTLFVLHTLRRLSWDPNLFASLTLSPYQIASLAVFGTFLQRETVQAKVEELKRSQLSNILTNIPKTDSPIVGNVSTSLILADTQQITDDVESRGASLNYWGRSSTSQPQTSPLKRKSDDDNNNSNSNIIRNNSMHNDKQKEEENNNENENEVHYVASSASSSLLLPEGISPRRISKKESIITDEGDDSSDYDRRIASAITILNTTIDGDEEEEEEEEEEDDDDEDHDFNKRNIAQSEIEKKLCVEVAMGSIAQINIARSCVLEGLRDCAVEVLCSTIISSLYTLHVTPGWVGGRTYGSCGGFLFQLMLVTGAISNTEEATSTLIYFFMHQVLLQCMKMSEIALVSSQELVSSNTNTTINNDNNNKRKENRSFSISSSNVHAHGSALDVFFFNVCRFNDLLVDLLSFNVMELSTLAPYFSYLFLNAIYSWPRRSLQQLRLQILKICIAVINKPSLQDVTPEIVENVYMLLTRILNPQWIIKDMLECLLRVLFRVYASLPPTSMDDEEATRRKHLIILCLRHIMRIYNGSKELRKALSARTLTQRFSLYKDFTDILLVEDETKVFVAFDIFCRDNMMTIDTLMSGRPKTKADIAFKSLLKNRSEYIKRINDFNEAYIKTTELKDQYRTIELIQAYMARFSSYIGHISPLKSSQVQWLITQCCSFEQSDPRLRVLRYVDSRGNYTNVMLGRNSENSEITEFCTDTCEQQLNHISAYIPPFAVRCRPFICDGIIPFIDPRCKVTSSAVGLLRYLLEPNEILRFISNGFRVNGIHATPCLILLTNMAIKLIGFSRITEAGDIILCQYEPDEEEKLQIQKQQKQQLEEEDDSISPLGASMIRQIKSKRISQQRAFSFAISMTNKLQKLITESGNGGKKKRESEAFKDGTKLAQSVRQATGHSYRDLYWIYLIQNITSVRMALYMHQDTAIIFKLMYDDGPLLSIVDAHQSMNTKARDEFLMMLKEVIGTQRCEFYEHNQRPTSIRSMLIRWAAKSVSTFDYLNFLNRVAGRTILDFNQYPVYPWVISDYKSNEIILNSPSTYRDLSLPMGAQTETRRKAITKLYEQMIEMQNAEEGMEGTQPFHHGTHYSTSGGVLHFLIRVEPYTTFARIFQGGEFDVASRLFDSIDASFQSCINGPADCKELIPEFFDDGMFLLNQNNYDFGEKSDGTIVNNVKLPPWAKGSTQVFIAVMRYALESNIVVNNIHRWIDLIFGVRRRGKLAVESYNVFQRMTYGEEVIRALKESHDPHDIDVIIAEVDNFGQTPLQLFQERHPAQRELDPGDSKNNNNIIGSNNNNDNNNSISSNNSNNNNNNNNITNTSGRSGNTYATAFNEQMPKVLSMIMHALDSPHTRYSFEDPYPGTFRIATGKLFEVFRFHETPVLNFVKMRNGERMCCYKYIAPVDDTNHVIYWSEGEHLLMRFDAISGNFISLLRYTLTPKAPISVTALHVSCRETLILIGSNSGTIYCLRPSFQDNTLLLLTATLCHHENPISGFAIDTYYGRVISFTTSGFDFPIVWCMQQLRTEKLHRLDISKAIPNTNHSERVVIAAMIDPRSANSIIITRRHLIIFDRHGILYGAGALPAISASSMKELKSIPHLEDESGQIGLAVDMTQTFIPSMTSIVTYNTLEWASGIQIIISGHQDGSIALWRVIRLPPEQIEHEKIAKVEFHGIIIGGNETIRLGAVTSIVQEERDVPVFLIGYHSGAVKVLRFDNSNNMMESTRISKA